MLEGTATEIPKFDAGRLTDRSTPPPARADTRTRRVPDKIVPLPAFRNGMRFRAFETSLTTR